MDLARCPQVPPSTVAALEEQAAHYWDLFYRRNADRFFKDRHYLDREFPCLLTAASILEVGCGVGNSLFPLAELNPSAELYGVDFAPTAIDAVRRHPGYGGRVHAHVADVTKQALAPAVPVASIDVATLFFVLSAISPEAMPKVLENIKPSLRSTGRVLVRDYARGDLAQTRLAQEGRAQQLADGFYVRWDGTRAFYFTEEHVCALFEEAGFECEARGLQARQVTNQKQGLCMDRLFVQCQFRLLPADELVRRQGQGIGASKATSCVSSGNPVSPCGDAVPAVDGNDTAATASTPVHNDTPVADAPALETLSWEGMSWEVPAGSLTAATIAWPSVLPGIVDHMGRAGALTWKRVLEWSPLGGGLAAAAALKWARHAVAAATDADALHLLRRNTAANADRVMFERLLLHTLNPGGDTQLPSQLSSVRRVFRQGIDYVFIAGLPWDNENDVQRLLGACRELVNAAGGQVWLLDDVGRASERVWPAEWQVLPSPAGVPWLQNLTILSLREME